MIGESKERIKFFLRVADEILREQETFNVRNNERELRIVTLSLVKLVSDEYHHMELMENLRNIIKLLNRNRY